MNDQIENAIREQRTNQAISKNLMGPSGKFGIILEAFGLTITRQGSGLHNSNYLDDAYDQGPYTEYESTMSGQLGPVVYQDEILDYDDGMISDEGLIFDGLSRGVHIEIIYWEVENEIKVSYRGNIVYWEIAGELESYAPNSDWEDIIERLFLVAKKRVKILRAEEEEINGKKIQQQKETFWQSLKSKWGL